MVKKRRMFDIEMPEEETFPAGKVEREEETPDRRRGPMASAIRETADSAREREQIALRIREENDALAHEYVRMQNLGLAVELVPLDAISTRKLVRDRAPGEDPELSELIASIRGVGLSNPIRLERAGQGGFELVQGFRRLAAYRAILEETGDAEAWGAIPAAIWTEGERLDALYRRMVDENLVRKGVSFAEMAQLSIDYAADPGVEETDADRAVAELFKSAGYQKRSYIRSFIRVLERIGPVLQHRTEIPRSLGTALAGRMDQVDGLAAEIRQALSGRRERSVEEELSVLRRYAGLADEPAKPAKGQPAPKKPGGRSKTSFQLDRPEGRARCLATPGRLEIKLDKDFSTVELRRLEAAVRDLLNDIE